jgi:hypothetical protein
VDGIYVAGELFDSGITYPLAYYDYSTWTFINPTGTSNAVGTSLEIPWGWFNEILLSIAEPSSPGVESLWVKADTGIGDWTKEVTVNGTIKASAISSLGRFIGGQFNSATIHRPIGDTVVITNNLLYYGSSNEWSPLNIVNVPDTV